MKRISIYNRKGGTGKTVLSLLLSRYLNASGYRVLAIDLDPQGSLTEILERLEGTEVDRARNSLSLVQGESGVEELTQKLSSGLYLIPSTPALGEAQATAMVPVLGKSLRGAPFDFIVLDNAPQWSLLIQASIAASDVLLIPTLPSIDDSEQALRTFEAAGHFDIPRRIVVFNQVGNRGGREEAVIAHYKEQFGADLCDISIPASTLIRQYTDQNEPLTRARGKAQVFDQIRDLAALLGGKKQPERF